LAGRRGLGSLVPYLPYDPACLALIHVALPTSLSALSALPPSHPPPFPIGRALPKASAGCGAYPAELGQQKGECSYLFASPPDGSRSACGCPEPRPGACKLRRSGCHSGCAVECTGDKRSGRTSSCRPGAHRSRSKAARRSGNWPCCRPYWIREGNCVSRPSVEIERINGQSIFLKGNHEPRKMIQF